MIVYYNQSKITVIIKLKIKISQLRKLVWHFQNYKCNLNDFYIAIKNSIILYTSFYNNS